MAAVTSLHDDRPAHQRAADIDRTLEQMGNGASALNRPIRCRVQPDLYHYGKKEYTSWHGLAWTVDLEDAAEGRRLRKGLTAFFKAFGGDARSQKQVLAVLEKLAGGR